MNYAPTPDQPSYTCFCSFTLLINYSNEKGGISHLNLTYPYKTFIQGSFDSIRLNKNYKIGFEKGKKTRPTSEKINSSLTQNKFPLFMGQAALWHNFQIEHSYAIGDTVIK